MDIRVRYGTLLFSAFQNDIDGGQKHAIEAIYIDLIA